MCIFNMAAVSSDSEDLLPVLAPLCNYPEMLNDQSSGASSGEASADKATTETYYMKGYYNLEEEKIKVKI